MTFFPLGVNLKETDRAGWLDSDYAAVNGKALNTAGVQKFLEYLRCHAV